MEITFYTYELIMNMMKLKNVSKMEEKRITSRAVTSTASMFNLDLVQTSRLVIIYQLCLKSDKYIQTY